MVTAPQKKLPAYGKAHMQSRMDGKIPRNRWGVSGMIVTFNWNYFKWYPRIVIERDVSPDRYELRFLAGLEVEIVYNEIDSHLIAPLAQEILKVNPKMLFSMNVDNINVYFFKRSDGKDVCL